ncbi:MAG: succinate dehydrogenase, hydrophobic membrane anchor protein [Gammaproteobacteria bacterium]
MKLRSPLGRVRGLGSAKSGLHHWWHQRLTALALIPLSLWFVNAILAHMDDSHAEVVNWIASPFVSAMLIALILSLFYHAKLGLQVVIEDYLHDELQKMVALVVMKFAVAFGALLGVVAVLKISLGMA